MCEWKFPTLPQFPLSSFFPPFPFSFVPFSVSFFSPPDDEADEKGSKDAVGDECPDGFVPVGFDMNGDGGDLVAPLAKGIGGFDLYDIIALGELSDASIVLTGFEVLPFSPVFVATTAVGEADVTGVEVVEGGEEKVHHSFLG